jgi:dihydroneopterin aldolase/2-amino-4-hydroxy-6-hydroxymethyldihydropteridine diphosphokinase
MARVFIGVGSNVDPEQNVERAIERLGRAVRVVGISTFYRTPPVGRAGAPDFVNGMIEAETDIEPADLKRTVLRPIEAELGRRRIADKYADRTIDLDLVLYGDLVVSTADLVLPDPDLSSRAFLAVPLFELAPDLQIPGSGISVRSLTQTLPALQLQPLEELTAKLRRNLAHE